MSPLKFLTLTLCVFTLSACQQTWEGLKEDIDSISAPSWAEFTPLIAKKEVSPELLVDNGNCPTIKIVEELATANTFSDISNPQDYNLISRALVTQAENTCSYSGKTATIDLKLTFSGQIGSKAQNQNSFSTPYFVAVTQPNGSILAKEVFSTTLTQQPGTIQTTQYETLRHIIPIANPNDGPKYKILIGFQLTQEQLQHNRAVIAAERAAKLAAEQAAKDAAKADKAPLFQSQTPQTPPPAPQTGTQRVTQTPDGPIIIYPQ